MKKIVILLTLSLLLIGCEKDFDPELTGSLSPDNFPESAEEYEQYMLQAYKPFGSKWGYSDVAYQNMFFSMEYGHIVMFDLPTDLFVEFTEWGGFWEFFSGADFNFLRNQGKESHFEKVRYVTRMTQIIADIENSDLDTEIKNNYIAQARMGRGWTMYYFLHMYGPLPVIIDPEEIDTEAERDLTRPSRETFVGYIEEDLQFASEHLEVEPSEYGRFNKGLALGILMKLYLNEKDWVQAEETGREIQNLHYSLFDNYAGLFREATERNSETIWAVSVDPESTGGNLQGNFNPWPLYNYPSDYPGELTDGGWSNQGVYTPTWEFYDSFDPDDRRRELMVAEYTNKSGELRDRSNRPGPVLVKYLDENNPDFQGADIPVLRYGDVVLMLAEAINNNEGTTEEAVSLVNEVRMQHGGIGPLSAEDTASREAFNNAILRERGWEFYFEGMRKMDLVRHDKWESALQEAGKTPGPALFPVPQYAIDVSDGQLSQTEGY